jgi:hypothetical protein
MILYVFGLLMIFLANGILGFAYERRPQEVEASGMFGLFNLMNIGSLLAFYGFAVAGFWFFPWWFPLVVFVALHPVRAKVSPRLIWTWKFAPMLLFICGLVLLVLSMRQS